MLICVNQKIIQIIFFTELDTRIQFYDFWPCSKDKTVFHNYFLNLPNKSPKAPAPNSQVFKAKTEIARIGFL